MVGGAEVAGAIVAGAGVAVTTMTTGVGVGASGAVAHALARDVATMSIQRRAANRHAKPSGRWPEAELRQCRNGARSWMIRYGIRQSTKY